jgi:protocatechuate 3,4-dioxygenase beta subunit
MDTQRVLDRRALLGLLAGAGVVALGACSKKADDSAAATSTTPTTNGAAGATTTVAAAGGDVDEIPSETGGPYPGDGTNGPDALSQSGVVRRDIRSSFGSASGTAAGVPLEIVLTIVDTDTDKAIPDAAVYLWHCDREGRYSMYSQGASDENYLRGVQQADANGVIRFTSIFPAAYSGRWPHIHFEIFDSLTKATSGRNARKVTQLALPESVCEQVYASSGYESSQSNMSRTSLSNDNVFRDGVDDQMATVTGSVASGFTASLTVGV